MNLLQELQDRISAWMSGQESLEDLFDWMSLHAEAIDDASATSDPLRILSGRAWNLLAMYRGGDANDNDVRKGLIQAGAVAPIGWGPDLHDEDAPRVQTGADTVLTLVG